MGDLSREQQIESQIELWNGQAREMRAEPHMFALAELNTRLADVEELVEAIRQHLNIR